MSDDAPRYQPEQPPDALRVWPGHQLREAREAQGRSQLEVARELRLDIGIIQALEQDNVDALPGPTYLYGYLRSYARLVNLSPDALIDAFQGEVRPTAELLPRDVQPARSGLPLASITRFVLLLALLAGIGVSLVWLLGQDTLLARLDSLLPGFNSGP